MLRGCMVCALFSSLGGSSKLSVCQIRRSRSKCDDVIAHGAGADPAVDPQPLTHFSSFHDLCAHSANFRVFSFSLASLKVSHRAKIILLIIIISRPSVRRAPAISAPRVRFFLTLLPARLSAIERVNTVCKSSRQLFITFVSTRHVC